LRRIAVLYHSLRERAVEEANWIEMQMRSRGVEVAIGNGWDLEVVERLCCDKQLVIALGGDGTIIHIARLAAPLGVPVVGVNLGRVGFLAEMTPSALHDRVDDLVEERFWTEEHTMLDVIHHSGDLVERFLALNEVAVTRGRQMHAVHVMATLDGEQFSTYTADGLLVSTATGSTAYSLAAGGPILYPESRDLLITPVAPHLHIGRSMLVAGDTVVSLSLASDRSGTMSVDGTDERPLIQGDTVEVCRSAIVSKFARFNPRRYFYSAIAARLK